MTTQPGNKLNRLQRDLPEGLLVDAAWMDAESRTGVLTGIDEAQNLPAILWKQKNLQRLTVDKRNNLAGALERVLFG